MISDSGLRGACWLLVCFSQLHALFYNGDILLFYAFCGLLLIPASGWSDRRVLIVATVLMLQPYAWGKMIYGWLNPEYVDTNSLFAQFAAVAEETGRYGGLIATLADNIWNGQLYSNFWQVEAGRLFQTPALFLLGMWLGRRNLFSTMPPTAFSGRRRSCMLPWPRYHCMHSRHMCLSIYRISQWHPTTESQSRCSTTLCLW